MTRASCPSSRYTCAVLSDKVFVGMRGGLSYYDRENLCLMSYKKMPEVFHGCTQENFPLIFESEADLKVGMTLFAVCAHKHVDNLQFLTFELMTNHVHIVVAGRHDDILDFFNEFKKILGRKLNKNLDELNLSLHPVVDLENLRNVIAYANRNGAVVDEDVCPYTYPWGANRFYFNEEAKLRYQSSRKKMRSCEIRSVTQSRQYDDLKDVYEVDGYASPMSFCAISLGEQLFRSARHYFSKVSRHIEGYDEIAKMIGESIYYTDDDLFQIVCTLSKKNYQCNTPAQLPYKAKIEIAKIIRSEYNASNKQIQRMLKIDQSVLTALFGK